MEKNSAQVADVLQQTKSAIQSYMIGLLIEALKVAILNSTALLILGVEYAILLGVIGALLNMLPYIGGIIAFAYGNSYQRWLFNTTEHHHSLHHHPIYLLGNV